MPDPLWSTVGKWIKACVLCVRFNHTCLTVFLCQRWRGEDRYLHCDRCHVGHDDRREEGGCFWLCHQDQSTTLSDGPDRCRMRDFTLFPWCSAFSDFSYNFNLSDPQMQYVFIFQALLEHYLYGDTELEVTSLESHLAKLYAPSPGAGCSGLEAEFKVCGLWRQLFCLIPWYSFLSICMTLMSRFLETNIYQDSEWQDENRQPTSQHEEEQSPTDHSMWVMQFKSSALVLCSISVSASSNAFSAIS